MSALLIKHGEWIVVCDGAKALVLENTGDVKFPNLKTVQVFEQKDLPTHLLGTDAPGRSHSSMGNGRSAVEQTDWHDQSEQAFLTHLAQRLDADIAAGKAKSLIVVSPRRDRQGPGQAPGARHREAPDRIARLSMFDCGWPAAAAMLWSPRFPLSKAGQ